VIVPSISSGIFSGMLIAFTMSIDDFLISFFNTGDNGGLFDLGSNNLSTYIYGSYNRTGFDLSVYAYSTLLSLLVFVALAAVYIRSSVKKAKAEHRFPKRIKEQKI
jgi:spermidine/putrescine transport system permease protein